MAYPERTPSGKGAESVRLSMATVSGARESIVRSATRKSIFVFKGYFRMLLRG